ncbi:MAG TPA: DUF1345 domain-containing protein [Rubrobacteraceae bacterium]|nr:DUF1345 domain-containing protein [Rubrobacteraceae bacterium]
MDKRPRPREDKLEEPPRGALDWLLRHLRVSYLLGLEPKEHQRGVLQYWPLVVVLLTVVAVHATLDDEIAVLPPLMLLALVLVVLVPIFYARRRGLYVLARFLGWGLLTISTAVVAASVFRLVVALPIEQTPSQALLNSGLVWLTNGATFALWYFEIDSGGPEKRQRDGHSTYDFMFPQDQNDDRSGWSPTFVDYLFLAFTTNLTFGPTDTAVLSRRAKVLTMIQSLLSVLIIAVVVARATAP